MKYLGLFLFLNLLAVRSLSQEVPFYLKNTAALFLFQTGQLKKAEELWLSELANRQLQGLLHYNLGAVWWKQKKYDQALGAWRVADEASDSFETQFLSRFNQGAFHQLQNPQKPNVIEALKAYQRALEVNPQSFETKVNIELLVQSQSGQGQSSQEGDQGEQGEGDKDSKDKQKKFTNPAPPKPQFKSEDLSQSDVNKILNELKRQEQKIRGEYQQKEQKEVPNGKDW